MHSSFIIKDHLFVIFGTRDDAEFLDLKSEFKQFKRLRIAKENTVNFLQPVVFVDEKKQIASFYGCEKSKGRKKQHKSLAYVCELEILWKTTDNKETPQEIKVVQKNVVCESFE